MRELKKKKVDSTLHKEKTAPIQGWQSPGPGAGSAALQVLWNRLGDHNCMAQTGLIRASASGPSNSEISQLLVSKSVLNPSCPRLFNSSSQRAML